MSPTRVNTSPTQVNMNQHQSDTSQKEPSTDQHKSKTNLEYKNKENTKIYCENDKCRIWKRSLIGVFKKSWKFLQNSLKDTCEGVHFP